MTPCPCRILMLTRQFYPWAGGTERQALRLSAELVQYGLDVHVVTGWWFQSTPRQETIEGVPIRRLFTFWQMLNIPGLRWLSTYLYIFSLFAYLWRHKSDYDIIHIHMIGYHTWVGVLAGCWWGKKTLVKVAASGYDGDVRRMQENRYIWGSRYMMPAIRHIDRVVSLNYEIDQELLDAGFGPEKIVQIPNGIETENIPSKTSYHLGTQARLIFVGRLHPQKNVPHLLEALAFLSAQHPQISWHLDILGTGDLESKLKSLAAELNIINHITFWGKVENVYEHLAGSDIFILPSRAEGISNALLEAMACGLPCIATRIPGNDVLIDHGQTGLLVSVNDPQSIAQAIVELIQHPSLRQRLGRAAITMIRSQFSIKRVAEQYIDLYHQLLDHCEGQSG